MSLLDMNLCFTDISFCAIAIINVLRYQCIKSQYVMLEVKQLETSW